MEPRRNDPCPCGSGRKYKKCCAARPGGETSDQLRQVAELVRSGALSEAVEIFAGPAPPAEDTAGTFYRLALALRERGQVTEAADCYRQALASRPEYVEALNNLGVILKDQGRPAEAAELLRRAVNLKPAEALLHYNLGVVLAELDLVDDACRSFEQVLLLDPGYVEAHFNLGLLARKAGQWATAVRSFRQAVALRPDYPRPLAELAILSWMSRDFSECAAYLERIGQSRVSLSAEDRKFVGPYRYFLEKLLAYSQAHHEIYQTDRVGKGLYAVGDSHCLAPAHLPVTFRDRNYRVESRLIVGAKAWHLGRSQANRYRESLEKVLGDLAPGALVLAMFGEIDCRLDEGIMRYYRKTGNDLTGAIPALVEDYVAALLRICGAGGLELLVANVPAPVVDNTAVPEQKRRDLARVVGEFNRALAACCGARRIPLLDVYRATVQADGLGNGQHHLDAVHLRPDLYAALLGEL